MGNLTITAVLEAPADWVFKFFTDSELHTDVTQSPASVAARVGGSFSAWDEYIVGEILELINGRKIVQSWRTTDFGDSDPDSILEILIEAITDKSTKLILNHSGLPSGTEGDYEEGWKDFYITPMVDFLKKI